MHASLVIAMVGLPARGKSTMARKIAQEIWQGWKSKNEQTKKVIEAQEAFLRELGRIQ